MTAKIEIDDNPQEERVSCSSFSCGSWRGRAVRDWSQIPLCLCGAGTLAITGITGVAYYLSRDIFLAMASSISGLSGIGLCLGACRIGMLKPRKDQEEMLEQMEAQNKTLMATINVFKRDKEELIKSESDLEEVLERYVEEKNHLWKELAEKDARLEDVASLLKNAQERLQVLEELYKEIKQKAKKVASEINRLTGEGEKTREDQNELSGYIEELDEKEDELSEEIDQFRNAMQYRDRQRFRVSKILDNVEAKIARVDKRFKAMKDVVAQLKASLDRVGGINNQFMEGARIIDSAADKFDKGLDEILDEISD